MKSEKNKRIEWIDVARGIGIVLVVLGHTGINANIGKWIFSFHMPLFFFISGLVFHATNTTTFVEFTKKRLKSWVMPYILYTLLIISFWALIASRGQSLWGYIRSVLLMGWGYNSTTLALWFIPVLTCTCVLWFCVIKYCGNKYKSMFFLSVFLLLGHVLNYHSLVLPYKLHVAFYAVWFLGIANIFSKKILSLERLGLFEFTGLMLACIIINMICVSCNAKVDMATNRLGSDFGFGLFGAMSGLFVIILLAMAISSTSLNIAKKSLVFLGQNTLFILATHQTICQVLRFSMTTFISNDLLLSKLVRHSLLWFLMVIIIIFKNRLQSEWLCRVKAANL